jgi:hypothetical protein
VVTRGRRATHSPALRWALAIALVLGALVVWSCRDRKVGNARADNNENNGPGARSGRLFVICTGDTYAALENCH